MHVSTYKIPTSSPESDGTLEWNSTTMIVVEVEGGGQSGIGYTYGAGAVAKIINGMLAEVVTGRDVMNVPASWEAMVHRIRNSGRPGICSMAISAVDAALWDLKAKVLGLPLVTLLGGARDRVPVYGSGGFTSYSLKQLQEQLGGWAEQCIPRVKMKIGREPEKDVERVRAAREAIGRDTSLFVDANGAYTRKQALEKAEQFAKFGVCWFEEPVSSDDLEGLRMMRDRAPAGMDIAAGEYGYDLPYFRRMLEAGAVDVLQADGTRCGGVTEFPRVAALCEAHCLWLSAHTAPSFHLHACLAAPRLVHLEYFHDHARIERMLFDGAATPKEGALFADLSRPGIGIELKRADAERFAA